MSCCSRYIYRTILLLLFIPKRELQLLWVCHLYTFSCRQDGLFEKRLLVRNKTIFSINTFAINHSQNNSIQMPPSELRLIFFWLMMIIPNPFFFALLRPPTTTAQATKQWWVPWKWSASQQRRLTQFIRSWLPFFCWWVTACGAQNRERSSRTKTIIYVYHGCRP